ncbi:MAG TPA: ribonuclease III [Candidatus Caenarcaniphilales bacterium]
MSLRDPRRQAQLRKLVEKLGLPEDSRIQWSLLDLALTHPTASAAANYEQLEFVGDAVMRLATIEFLWEAYSHCSVGELSAIRSILISDRILAQIGASYGLERYLLVAPSGANDPNAQESRLAETLEAVLGALYLSSHNLKLIRPWLDRHLQQQAEAVRSDPAYQNYKAALQTWTQAHHQTLPQYRIQDSQKVQDAHRYTAEVWLKGQQIAQGSGRSIKAAEKVAAQAAFMQLVASDPEPATE